MRHVRQLHQYVAHKRRLSREDASIFTALRNSGALAYFLQSIGSQLPGFRVVAASDPRHPPSLHPQGVPMTTAADVLKLIKDKEVKYVDLRFTDTKGKEQHVTVPTRVVDEAFFEDGKGFDGSSIAGWKGIQESDMILMPDPSTAILDPFFEETTLDLRCDIVEPSTMQGYERDPRSLAKRAEAYLKSTGIADTSSSTASATARR
jgi:hypothetical protein